LEYHLSNDSKLRLGVVGAGRIAPHHLKAAVSNGFILDSICARNNSKNAYLVGSEFGFRAICKTFEEFLNQQVDAYLILTETSAQVSIARHLLKKNKPILVEKPVSVNLDEIKSLRKADKENRIVVGYNRRSLSSTKELKSILNNLKPYYFQINVPELASVTNASNDDISYMILENSVHIFDLAFFLFGKPSSWNIKALNVDSRIFARSIELEYGDSHLGSMLVTIGVPDNWSIIVHAPGNRFVLSPLEVFNHFDRIESVAATSDRPNKLYFPKTAQVWSPDVEDLTFKAGFYAQIRDFQSFVLSNNRPDTLSSLSDAEFVLSFAKSVLQDT
jgi:predicted dehydrogenase